MNIRKQDPELPNTIRRCVCGDEMIIAEKLLRCSPEDEVEYVISLNSAYLGNRRSKLKGIWNILRGKEKTYAEIVLTESDFRKFLVGCATLMHK